MVLVRIERHSRLSADEAWRRLTDWGRHAEWVPFTQVTVGTTPPTGVGTLFVARTGVGRCHVDDPMEVVGWQPPAGDRPGHCRVEKRGRAVSGWAQLTVGPHGGGSSILWCEEVRLRKMPHLFDPLMLVAARLLFGRVINGLLAG